MPPLNRKASNPYSAKKIADQRRLGILLAIVLIAALGFIGFKSFVKVTDHRAPVQLVAADAAKLEKVLRSGKKFSSVVLFYTADCPDCEKQVMQYTALMHGEANQSITFLLVSLDDQPGKAGTFIRKLQVPEDAINFYADTTQLEGIVQYLKRLGAQHPISVPYTLVFDKQGILVSEYPGLVPAEEITMILELLTTRQR